MASSRPSRKTWILSGVALTLVILLVWLAARSPLSSGTVTQRQLTFTAQLAAPLAESSQLAQVVSTVRTSGATMKRLQLTTTLDSLDTEAAAVARQVGGLDATGVPADERSAVVAAAVTWAAAAHTLTVALLATLGGVPTPPAADAGSSASSATASSLSAEVSALEQSGGAGTALASVAAQMSTGDADYARFVSLLPGAVRRASHLPRVVWNADPSLWNPQQLAVFGSDIRTSTSLATDHDVGVVLVSTDPQPIGGGADPTLISTGHLDVTVVVENAGNVDEPSVPVAISLAPAGSPTADQPVEQQRSASIALLPGQRTTTRFAGLVLKPGYAYQLTVTAGPVDGQVSYQGTRYAEIFTAQQ